MTDKLDRLLELYCKGKIIPSLELDEYFELKKEIDENIKQAGWFKIIPELMECDINDNEKLGKLFQAIKSNKDKAEKYDQHIKDDIHIQNTLQQENKDLKITKLHNDDYTQRMEQENKKLKSQLEQYKAIVEYFESKFPHQFHQAKLESILDKAKGNTELSDGDAK